MLLYMPGACPVCLPFIQCKTTWLMHVVGVRRFRPENAGSNPPWYTHAPCRCLSRENKILCGNHRFKIKKKLIVFKNSFLLGILFFGFSVLYTETIKEIVSIKQAQNELERADENTLVVFDIDKTLLVSDVPISFMDQEIKFDSVEKETVEIIRNLQSRGVPIIALTHSGSTPEICRWRVDNLQQIELDFSNSFALKEFEFDKLPMIFDAYPSFYRGILCTGGIAKGVLLAAFIQRIGWLPHKVIFFDDQFQFCLNVHLEMSQRGIPVQCYWYRAAYKKCNP